MKKLSLLFGAVLALLGLSLGAGSASAAYPPGGHALTVSKSTLAPNETFTATFTGALPGEDVFFEVNPTATGVANAEGTATVQLNAPATPGPYTVTATGLTSGRTATAAITVVVAPAPPPGGDLPATGSDSSQTTMIAAGLVIVGVGLVAIAGLRRRGAHA